MIEDNLRQRLNSMFGMTTPLGFTNGLTNPTGPTNTQPPMQPTQPQAPATGTGMAPGQINSVPFTQQGPNIGGGLPEFSVPFTQQGPNIGGGLPEFSVPFTQQGPNVGGGLPELSVPLPSGEGPIMTPIMDTIQQWFTPRGADGAMSAAPQGGSRSGEGPIMTPIMDTIQQWFTPRGADGGGPIQPIPLPGDVDYSVPRPEFYGIGNYAPGALTSPLGSGEGPIMTPIMDTIQQWFTPRGADGEPLGRIGTAALDSTQAFTPAFSVQDAQNQALSAVPGMEPAFIINNPRYGNAPVYAKNSPGGRRVNSFTDEANTAVLFGGQPARVPQNASAIVSNEGGMTLQGQGPFGRSPAQQQAIMDRVAAIDAQRQSIAGSGGGGALSAAPQGGSRSGFDINAYRRQRAFEQQMEALDKEMEKALGETAISPHGVRYVPTQTKLKMEYLNNARQALADAYTGQMDYLGQQSENALTARGQDLDYQAAIQGRQDATPYSLTTVKTSDQMGNETAQAITFDARTGQMVSSPITQEPPDPRTQDPRILQGFATQLQQRMGPTWAELTPEQQREATLEAAQRFYGSQR